MFINLIEKYVNTNILLRDFIKQHIHFKFLIFLAIILLCFNKLYMFYTEYLNLTFCLDFLFILYAWVFACRFVCMSGVQRGQKRLLDALELELWIVVSHHVVLGTESEPSARATRALYHRSTPHLQP